MRLNRIMIKICGITSREDALKCIRAGSDAIGFIFADSPRNITPEQARKIVEVIPPFITTVGVFVDEDAEEIKRIIKYCGIDIVQLHGEESPSICEKLMPRTIKTLRFKDKSSLNLLDEYKNRVRAILLDTYDEKLMGGTGRPFNWELGKIAKAYRIPIILAGGLNPRNITDAIRIIRPMGVDANSGVETGPGKKSFTLIKEFISNVRKLND